MKCLEYVYCIVLIESIIDTSNEMKSLASISLLLLCVSLVGQSKSAPVDSLISEMDQKVYSEPAEMVVVGNDALRIALSSKKDSTIAAVQQRLGLAHQLLGNYDSAKHYLFQSNDYWNETSNDLEIANTSNTLGIVFDEQGKDDEAIKYYLDALRLYEKLEDQMGKAKVYNNLGIIHKKNNRFDKVVEYYGLALEIYREVDHTFGIAATTGNIGSAMLETKEYESSIEYSLESIEGYKASGIDQYIPYSLENIGLAYKGLGRLKEADEYHRQAFALYEKYGNQKEAAFTLGSRAQIKYDLNDLDSARILAEKAYQRAAAINVLEEMKRSSEVLIKSLLKRNQNGADYFFRYLAHADSLTNQNRNKAIAEMQERYETEKKEREIEALQAEAELKDLRNSQNILMFVGLLIVGALLIVGMILNTKRRNYKLRAVHSEEKQRLLQNRFRAVIEAEENERKRIAQELHDGLGQLLSAARMSISSLDEEEKNAQVKNSLELVDSAVGEVRTISHNLLPRALEKQGLVAALKEQVRRVNEANQVQVILEASEPEVDQSIKTALYRIIQEVINNALKYADANEITVKMDWQDNNVSLNILENGRGFDTSKIEETTGIGWQNIFSRVEVMGGKIEIQSEINNGTRVTIFVPNGGKH